MFFVCSWQGGLHSWDLNGGEKEPAEGNILTKYERQGQRKGNFKYVTVLPVAKYASWKQSEINRDEPFYYKEKRFLQEIIHSPSLCPFLHHYHDSFTKEERTEKSSLISRICKSLNIHLKQLPPTEKAVSFDHPHCIRREMAEGSIFPSNIMYPSN